MPMPPTRRHNRKQTSVTPESLAARLPTELSTFDDWYRHDNGVPSGLHDYVTALAGWIGGRGLSEQRTTEVMEAAGLSVAGWYLTMLSKST